LIWPNEDLLVNKIARILAVLLFAGAAGAGDYPNLLLGKWKLSAEPGGAAPAAGCLPQVEFAAKTYTRTDPGGKVSTIPVTYVTAQSKSVTFPTSVYVMTDAGIYYHTTYVFKTNKDRMFLSTALVCPYVRQ
jgi:hypothetical protein